MHRLFPPLRKQRQTGAALLVLVILMLAGATVFSMSFKEPNKAAAFGRDVHTLRHLREAKELLIGASFKENNRPGELRKAVGSTPHGDGDGIGTMPNGPGHVPWRQLHASPRSHTNGADDEEREAIWYFLDPAFGTNGDATNNDGALNYETAANLTIDGIGEYAAVLVAAGKPLNEAQGAVRPSRHYADITAYLEDENAVDGTTNFVTESVGEINDVVLGISKDELMLRAADFAAKKLVGRLREYNDDEGSGSGDGCFQYPAPAAYDPELASDSSPPSSEFDSYEDPEGVFLTVGMIPIAQLGVKPEEWHLCEASLSAGIDSFIEQHWVRFIRYARAQGGNGGVGCQAGSDCLEVQVKDSSGVVLQTYDDVEALVILSGKILPGRSWVHSEAAPLEIDQFFEGENVNDDTLFEQGPEREDQFNDRLYIVSHSDS